MLEARSGAWRGIGCIAVRCLQWPRQGEVKRLFVDPAARGLGAGHLLSLVGMAFAQQEGYTCLYLDSLRRQAAAVALYSKLGFSHCEQYCANPEEDAVYMKQPLPLADATLQPLMDALQRGKREVATWRLAAWLPVILATAAGCLL